MKRGYLLVAFLGFTIVVLSIVQISVSNMLSTGGIELSSVQSQIGDLQKENAILKEQIYSVASLTHIASEAEKLGYVQGVSSKSTALVIANPQPLAIKP